MRAAGIDLGGTKSEVQLFDQDWALVDRRRDATPASYDALVAMLTEQVRWVQDRAGEAVPVGIGAAGLVDAEGNAFTANLPAMGRPLPADIARAAGHRVTYVNDCRALALSEAVFGAGRGHATVMSLIMGTGVGGGVAHRGALWPGPAGTGGEFGHMPVSGPGLLAHGLALRECGCGRRGCVESYVSGPGLARTAREVAGRDMTPEEVAAARATDPGAGRSWAAWLDLAADMALALVQAVDPDVIVLGGGLSRVDGLVGELEQALAQAQIPGFGVPPIVLAEGGDASGARGAALAASQEAQT
ncbi:ROK family protein [Ponticoccus sp. SC2-23]|nr:ROK family protein [Ponticoccus sp. SC6-9]MBM1225486.1 ROK family protein [Ponticoccus sp. SC6-15]MBM1227669.1 ROK family protein [Ponticoccus sp. SC6-38]MBM1234693.1 ROK family protein [Ponticoccus sp. SC6-45]MBM1238171.1 ROK family protein [Ponticoccus sp. SC6-49]MBM1244196.1 ROK family protein [Ponticoccus sp. SC2-64]MBM1248217.1 ROK family protein [Ponticoccus sp. SC6-42]MBM1252571.1 ROK family protein [Ponticoccus sp. SC6-33]MBM1256180.1 ROK family protein [Ponticoccus sp. SC6-60]M